MVDLPVEPGSSGGYPSDMATRVAMLETIAQNTQVTLAAIQQDMRELRQMYAGMRQEIDTKVGGLRQEMEIQSGELRRAVQEQGAEQRRVHDRDFRLTFGAIIASTLGLAALIAHVAHWI